MFGYCLGIAAHKHGVEVHAACVMSNHYHLVLTDVRGVLPDFMRALNRSVAMSVKRLRHWDEVVWEPNVPYNAVALHGPAEIVDKVAYTLLNPVSAALVRTPKRWPGLLSTLEVLRHGALHARRPQVWFNERAPSRATVHFTMPPGFEDKGRYLCALASLLKARLVTLRTEHRRQGLAYWGAQRVRRTRFLDRPKGKKKRFGTSPTFSALTRARWRDAVRRLRGFRHAYRVAYEAWRDGRPEVLFPLGTWWVVRYGGASAVT